MPYLYEVVEHEGGDAGSTPLGVRKDERYVRLVVLDVRHHERKADDALPVENDTAEVWILETLGHCRHTDNTTSRSVSRYNKC